MNENRTSTKKDFIKLMKSFLASRIDPVNFGDELHSLYVLNDKLIGITEEEKVLLGKLHDISSKYSEFEGDHQAVPGFFYTENEVNAEVGKVLAVFENNDEQLRQEIQQVNLLNDLLRNFERQKIDFEELVEGLFTSLKRLKNDKNPLITKMENKVNDLKRFNNSKLEISSENVSFVMGDLKKLVDNFFGQFLSNSTLLSALFIEKGWLQCANCEECWEEGNVSPIVVCPSCKEILKVDVR